MCHYLFSCLVVFILLLVYSCFLFLSLNKTIVTLTINTLVNVTIVLFMYCCVLINYLTEN